MGVVEKGVTRETNHDSLAKERPKPLWVATDMDGTFFNSAHRIPKSTQEAYEKLVKSQIPVVPCTGRSLRSLQQVLDVNCPDFKPKIFPGVFLNGTVVYGRDENDLIYCHELPKEAVKAYLKAYYQLVEGDEPRTIVYVQGTMQALLDFDTPFWQCFNSKYKDEPPVILNRPLIEVIDDYPGFKCCNAQILGEKEDLEKIKTHLTNDPELQRILMENDIRVVNSLPVAMAALINSENKAKGLSQLARRYPELRLENVLTLGDQSNDVEMLSATSWSVAMGQAPEHVKKAARFVTTASDEDGWATAVLSILF